MKHPDHFRYVLVDYMHIAHRTIAMPPLSASVMINNVLEVVDTTIPSMTIKNIYNLSNRGRYAVGVCLEGGGASVRKEKFQQLNWQDVEYKSGRKSGQSAFFQGINLAVSLMHQGGVSLYKQEGLEADDCIANLILKLKAIDKETPIDVITNDADLLPFVDEQVSVYMRGTRQFAEEDCPEHSKYYQVTPRTWEEYLSYSSAYQGYNIPYNSMLLFKMIRGDKSDSFKGAVTGYGKVKYSALMAQMIEDDVLFEEVFRYENDFDRDIKPVLLDYFTEEEVQRMRDIFYIIRPFGANLGVPKQIIHGNLQQVLVPLQINL